MMGDYECPYCGEQIEYSADGIGEGETQEEECPTCEKVFHITASYSRYFHVDKTPCLNNEKEHDWQPIIGVPVEFFKNRRRCSMCGEEKEIEQKVK